MRAIDTSQYPDKALAWSARTWAGEKLNSLGARFSAVGSELPAVPSATSYAELFKLDRAKPVTFSDLKDPKAYQAKVAKNFRRLQWSLKEGDLFQDVTPKRYLNNTVYRGNVSPIASAAKGIKARNFTTAGSGLAHIFGLGFLAYDVLDETKEVLDEAGPLEAAKTFVLKAFKNLATWEAAMVGLTFGRALLPGIGCLPLGGILAGAAVSVGTSKLLDKAIPHKPDHQHQTEALEKPWLSFPA